MPQTVASAPAPEAIVARKDVSSPMQQYLLVKPSGGTEWVSDPQVATKFCSMREATRMALRLPSYVRAFGLPRMTESLAL